MLPCLFKLLFKFQYNKYNALSVDDNKNNKKQTKFRL